MALAQPWEWDVASGGAVPLRSLGGNSAAPLQPIAGGPWTNLTNLRNVLTFPVLTPGSFNVSGFADAATQGGVNAAAASQFQAMSATTYPTGLVRAFAAGVIVTVVGLLLLVVAALLDMRQAIFAIAGSFVALGLLAVAISVLRGEGIAARQH